MRVHGYLILCGVSDQSFSVGEGDIGWCGSVTLCIEQIVRLQMISEVQMMTYDRWR